MIFSYTSRVATSILGLFSLVCNAENNCSSDERYIITFGDSYTQTGFNIASTKPSLANPLGNPIYPGYTTSGGPNWIGYLVKNYYINSYNFADGGATVNASLVKPYKPTVKSLIDQVELFSNSIANRPSYASWTNQTAEFVVWLGVNDVGNSYSSSANVTALLGNIMDSYFTQLDILYVAGARIFMLLNVPPIDKTPMMRAQSKEARILEAEVIKQFNDLLHSRLVHFIASHEVCKGWVVDTQELFNKAINDPVKYGSKDATCYNSDGKTCLWFDDYHPGMAIHELVAAAVVDTHI